MDESPGWVAESARDLLASVAAALGWHAANIWLVDDEASVLRCVEVWTAEAVPGSGDFERASLALTLSRGIGLPGRVWRDREPRWITDVVDDPNFPRAAVAEQSGLHAAMALPIIADDGELRGVVEFFRTEAGEVEEDTARTSLAIGRQVGRLIEWKAAEAATRWSEARKSAILSAALDAVITIDHAGRVTEWNDAAERIFGYPRTEVLGVELAQLIVPPTLRDAHRAALERYIAGAPASGRLIGARTELPARRADGSEFPVELTLTRVELPGPPIVTAFVRDISDRLRLDREREAFRIRSDELQAALLPHVVIEDPRIDLIASYRPGEHRLVLGGDFYDAVELPDGGLAVVIGDVSGHGPEAAALGANLRAAWRMLASAGRDPAMLLRELELMVCAERRQPDLFVTVCCGWISPDGGAVRVISAGHPAPLVFGRTPTAIPGLGGPPLGVIDAATWAVVDCSLAAGEQLVLYTDGLIEGRSRPGSSDRLGLQGLIDLVPAGVLDLAALDSLVDAAAAAHGEALPDDVAVVAVRVRPPLV
jgi:PAS domain S-box-containing protein